MLIAFLRLSWLGEHLTRGVLNSALSCLNCVQTHCFRTAAGTCDREGRLVALRTTTCNCIFLLVLCHCLVSLY